MAEFAIIALVFFMIIIGVIESGRLLYTHNALNDATRRAARYAVIHPENVTCVKNVAVYGETNITPFPECAPVGTALINGLTPDMVTVTYLGANIDEDPDIDTTFGTNLGTAQVSITGYTFNFNIPLFTRNLTLPAYSVTLTAESAGLIPADLE